MEIFRDEELGSGWPIQSFQEAYQNVAGENICKCFTITMGDKSGNPDNTSVIFVRLFIENGERAKKDQKYIAGLRFYSFGDMATIDIISLDKSNHRDIVQEHANRMGWVVLSESMGEDALLEAYRLPVFAVGAHLQVADNGVVNFTGNSADFSGNLLGFNVNEVVKQLSFLAGLKKDVNVQGEIFLEELLTFLLQNKKKQDFYESFVEHYISGKMTGQNIGGLLTMKVIDRALKEEDGNILKLFIEEATGGFANKCLLVSAEQKRRSS